MRVPYPTQGSHFKYKDARWQNVQNIPSRQFICGFCNVTVSPDRGFALLDPHNAQLGGIYICPNCNCPNIFSPESMQIPSPSLGSSVHHVPHDLNELYEEARRATSQNCYTGAVLLARKMLMNIAVTEGAPPGQSFVSYVDYLNNNGYLPPNGRGWVDHIRKKGNEGTHEIALMNKQDAEDLLNFIEMLLKFIYEFPSRIVPPPGPVP